MSAAGGLTGAVLLLSTPVRLFDGLLPWLLLLATSAFLFGGRISTYLRSRAQGGPAVVLPLQFALGIYGGYFGGAVGIMALAAWSLVDRHDLKALHPTRMLTVAAMNVIAVAYFVARSEVRWPETMVMLVGAGVGGFVGGRIGQRLPPTVTRYVILGMTVVTTLVFFRRAYF
jgi:uncharacterized membrane protein YfcA